MLSHPFLTGAAALALFLSLAAPAVAQDTEADASSITVAGSVALGSDCPVLKEG